jgi:hypothetical protein
MSGNPGDMEINANNAAALNATNYASGVNSNFDLTIGQKNNNLIQKNKINLQQEIAIADKQKLFLTRSRMLQVSMDKNAYKTKIMYTLIAIILFIFIFTLGIYAFVSKKK